MAGRKKKKLPRLTAEELARREANRQLAYERAAYHEAMSEKLGERERERRALSA